MARSNRSRETKIVSEHKHLVKFQLWSQFLSITNMLSLSGPPSKQRTYSAEIQVIPGTVFKNIWNKACHSLHACTCMACAGIHRTVWQSFPFYSTRPRKAQWQNNKDFFRFTNQRGLDSLKQIALKRNRVEYLEDIGCQRGKRSFNCSNCNLYGHNIKTCLSKTMWF